MPFVAADTGPAAPTKVHPSGLREPPFVRVRTVIVAGPVDNHAICSGRTTGCWMLVVLRGLISQVTPA